MLWKDRGDREGEQGVLGEAKVIILNNMFMEVLTEEVKLHQRLKEVKGDGEEPFRHREKNNKGPAAAMCLVGSEDSKYPE